MTEVILSLVAIAVMLNIIVVAILLRRSGEKSFDRFQTNLRDELRSGREESAQLFRDLRGELAVGLKTGNDTVRTTLTSMGQFQQGQLAALTKEFKDLTESNQSSLNEIRGVLDTRLEALQEGNEKKLEESAKVLRQFREELATELKSGNASIYTTLADMSRLQLSQIDTLTKQLRDLTESNQTSLDQIRGTLDSRVQVLQEGNEKKLEESAKLLREFREELGTELKTGNDSVSTILANMSQLQQSQIDGLTKQLRELTESNQSSLDRIRSTLDSRVQMLQEGNEKKLEESAKAFRELREEMATGLKSANDTVSTTLVNMSHVQHAQLEALARQLREMTESNQNSLDQIRTTLDLRVHALQEGNEKKLEEMRLTVDEKLQNTLETRLGQAFKAVSERLDSVQHVMGEMQSLATGVGDLQRVLSNVKVRGTWAEVQLGAILEQLMAPSQFARNVRTKQDSAESVEYAIRLPGLKGEPDGCIWLPLDSKFPREDYLRVQDAAERGDADALQKATDALARTLRVAAQEIHEKHVNPPTTTDFAIMFLATEGLYAEALRQPGLTDELQQKFRIVVAGPTTLAAILSSLRMGFQTMAIEQHAAEVWQVLAAVKTEFNKFGGVLERVRRQLNTASRTIEVTGVRTRAMERKLRSVEELTEEEASRVLDLLPEAELTEDDEEHQLEPEVALEELDVVEDGEPSVIGLVDEDDIPF